MLEMRKCDSGAKNTIQKNEGLSLKRAERKQLKSETEKQFSSFKSTDYLSILLRPMETTSDTITRTRNDFENIVNVIQQSTDNKANTLIHATLFLWFYESTYSFCIDIFCFLLTINGHDLFNSIKRKYASSFEDVHDVDMYTKLLFLEEHNFGIFKREQDRKLRNKIAHYDFSIETSIEFKIDGIEINLFKRLKELGEFSSEVMEIFVLSVNEYIKKNKSRIPPDALTLMEKYY